MGRRRAVVVDPGPDRPEHVDAVAAAVGDADSVLVLLTHGHADHSGAATELARRMGVPVLGAWGGTAPAPPPSFRPLADGERVASDAGELVAVATPGHAPEHLAFHWPAAGAVFVGDLLLGRGDTTWVGAYPGCVADYLASLDRVDALAASLLLPAHGDPILDPGARIARYRAHRMERLDQVRRALAEDPRIGEDELYRRVYGRAVPEGLARAARLSLRALAEHVRSTEG